MSKDLAIVLCTGSVNSAVATTLAAQKHRLVMLSADMGSASGGGARKRGAYDLLVGHFKPFREHTLPLQFLSFLKRSSPASALSGVDPRIASDLSPRLIELTPLIALAVRFAAHYGATAIYTGIRIGRDANDLARATEFFQIWSELTQLPAGLPDLEIEKPLLELEPWEIIDLGTQIGTPWDKTWSCEQDTAEPCLVCPGCRLREAAFDQAARQDPLRKKG